jgi:hypothetical protein
MKPAESMVNMVSRLQTLKLVLKQPEPTSVFKFLDAIRPKSLADKVKDILRMKKMDPNQWTVKDVGDIAIRLEKAQGEESLWMTSKPIASVVLPFGVSGGSSAKNTSVTFYHCGRLGHMKNKCPYKNGKATKKKAVTNARASFANPKANRSDDKRCYTCNKPGHIAKDCPQQKGNVTKQIKGKPWCSHHKINTHASESCWALHPELRPSYLNERAAQSARQARVIPAKTGSSLSANLGSALLSATKEPQSKGNLKMDSYYAEVVMTECPHSTVEPFAVNARAAMMERRSAETQGLRRVTQSEMPLSYLPYPDAPTRVQHPVREPVPPVITDELGSFTPRQFRSPRGDDAHTGKNVIDEDLLDATDLSHHSSKESDKEEMPQSFDYLSEEDPNFKEVWNLWQESNCLGRRTVCLETDPEKKKKALLTMRFLERAVCPRKDIRQIPLMMSLQRSSRRCRQETLSL